MACVDADRCGARRRQASPPEASETNAMDESKLRYDADREELRYDSGLRGTELLARDVGKALSRVGRDGIWRGQRVNRVVVDFDDDEAASHNADAMAFLRLVPRGPGGEVKSDARFVTRDDFGVQK